MNVPRRFGPESINHASSQPQQKPLSRPLWLLVCLLSALNALPGAGALIQTPSVSAVLRDGAVLALTNRLTGEGFVLPTSAPPSLAALHPAGQPPLAVQAATETSSGLRTEQSAAWPAQQARWQLRVEQQEASDDLAITQRGEFVAKGLAGISWGVAGIPDHFEVLVPGRSGQRFGTDAPAGRQEFDYPMGWEAPFVLIQGKQGGFLIRAEDEQYRFKNLVLEHAQRAFRLRFESRSFAPFEDKARIESSRWRIAAYRGPWQAGAALYRNWAQQHYALTSLEQQQPAWARDIRFVVIMALDLPLLKELARHCHPPQTLLYIANWRRDGYDRNYPDYTAFPNFGPFVEQAHQLGFRVMPHVNYFGCDPKHPLYAQFKVAQMRNPFSKELLWWEWPAEPPIKFAYINPASRAWRELFVQRMAELVQRHHVDALHLDQTLCIYNDANGPIDGRNCIEGNVELHRELRRALPEVALSGEGLNEVTCRYEALAQRHVWGMDHAHGTWSDRLIAMAHPVSSAVLTPFTHLYGYLGMANPANSGAFTAWRRAYEHFGVLPTYAWPDLTQLAKPPPGVAEVLTQAHFFQQHKPAPDYDSPWQTNDLFVYRLMDGGRAFFQRDEGVVFAAQLPNKPVEVFSRRLEGVSEARVAGSVPGWPAYDATRILGLNPRRFYSWSPQPRDLTALHITDLPAGATVEQSGLHAAFARLRFGQAAADAAGETIRLWEFAGQVSPGIQLGDGRSRRGDALDFADETGGAVHPEGEGLFLHPPWQKLGGASGRHFTFIDFDLRLTAGSRLRFESGVHLREAAVGKSDGAAFTVRATSGGKTLSAQVLNDRAEAKPLALDLTSVAGQEIRLRLEVDAGPKGNPSFDWARFERPRINAVLPVAASDQTVRLTGGPMVRQALTSAGPVPIEPDGAGGTKVKVAIPGTLVLPLVEPVGVSLPFDLLPAKFTSHVVYTNGIETAGTGYFVGGVTTASCAAQPRRVLALHPPPSGRSLADYLLQLPNTPARFISAIGVRDGSKSEGVGFEVEVNGAAVFSKSLKPGTGWVPVEVDLARWRGQPVLLTLVTDAEGGFNFDWAVWAEPSLVLK